MLWDVLPHDYGGTKGIEQRAIKLMIILMEHTRSVQKLNLAIDTKLTRKHRDLRPKLRRDDEQDLMGSEHSLMNMHIFE